MTLLLAIPVARRPLSVSPGAFLMPSFIPEVPLFTARTLPPLPFTSGGFSLQLCFFFAGPLFRAEKLA